MNQIKREGSLLLAVLWLVLLCGCGSDRASSSPQPDLSDGAFPLTITDHLGRSVTLDAPPQRIVSGYYITTSLLIALDCTENVVGVEIKAGRFPVVGLAAPSLLELPNVGSAKEFDLEGCAALKPDLVLLPVKLKEAAETLEGMGIAVLAVDPEDSERLLETIAMVGAATDRAARAQSLGDAIRTGTEAIRALTEAQEKPRVYFAGNSSYLNTAGSRMYQHSLLETAGAVNVAAELTDSYWANVSAEQVLAWNPDVIVIAPGAAYTAEDLRKDPALQNLQAVRDNCVYVMPSSVEYWDAPVPSAVLGSLWLASILHPQQYGASDFARDFGTFYREFYNIEVQVEAE